MWEAKWERMYEKKWEGMQERKCEGMLKAKREESWGQCLKQGREESRKE